MRTNSTSSDYNDDTHHYQITIEKSKSIKTTSKYYCNLVNSTNVCESDNNDDHNSCNDDDDDDGNTCSVCLEPFSVDEVLSCSKPFKCKHIFHSECLIPWLMKHEDCPCCRTTLLTTQDFLDKTYDCVDNKIE